MDFLTPTVILVLLIVLTLFSYWFLSFVIFYHLIRFGIGTQPKKIAAVFLFGSIAFFFLSVFFFAGIDIQGTRAIIADGVGSITFTPN